MLHDFADSFVQAMIYLCFLAVMIFFVGFNFFHVVHWFIRWMVS